MIDASPEAPQHDAVTPPDRATCIRCRYPLRGLTSRACPECGQSFDPNVPWTMRVPGAASAREVRCLEPARWNFKLLRRLLIVLAVLSSWFVAPHPLPTLALAFVWLLYALPHFQRTSDRRRLVDRYGFAPEIIRIDDTAVRRLRIYFSIASVVIASQLPFLAAYAISYPFITRSAHHWWAEVPSTENPPKGWTIRGVFPVRIDAGVSVITFQLPSGKIRFVANEERNVLAPELVPELPD